MKVIKRVATVTAPILFHLNSCLICGIFLCGLDIGEVTPVHKANGPSGSPDFRPISVFPALSKILEKFIIYLKVPVTAEHPAPSSRKIGQRKKH